MGHKPVKPRKGSPRAEEMVVNSHEADVVREACDERLRDIFTMSFNKLLTEDLASPKEVAALFSKQADLLFKCRDACVASLPLPEYGIKPCRIRKKAK